MGVIEGIVLSIIATVGPTTVLASNALYVGLMGAFAVGTSLDCGIIDEVSQ